MSFCSELQRLSPDLLAYYEPTESSVSTVRIGSYSLNFTYLIDKDFSQFHELHAIGYALKHNSDKPTLTLYVPEESRYFKPVKYCKDIPQISSFMAKNNKGHLYKRHAEHTPELHYEQNEEPSHVHVNFLHESVPQAVVKSFELRRNVDNATDSNQFFMAFQAFHQDIDKNEIKFRNGSKAINHTLNNFKNKEC